MVQYSVQLNVVTNLQVCFIQKQIGISLSDKQLQNAQGKSYTIELSNKESLYEILSI